MSTPDKIFAELNTLIEKGDEKAVLEFIKTKELTAEEYYAKERSFLDLNRRCVTRASELGHENIVNTLIDLGFDPNEQGHRAFRPIRPIHLACENGHLAVVKTLMENHGVKVDMLPREPSALSMAIFNNMVDVYKYLIEEQKVPVNIPSKMGGNSLLYVAIKNKDLALCKCLIDHGADVNTPFCKQAVRVGKCVTDMKVTALKTAVGEDLTDIVRLLLDAGANVDEKDGTDATSLIMAVNNDNCDLVKLLSTYGADPEVRDNNGNAPLHVACFFYLRNRYNIIRHLVCDLNVSMYCPDKEGMTPFALAAEDELFPIMHLFLRAGFMSKEVVLIKNNFSLRSHRLNYFGKFLKEAFTPRTLQELSCFKIRRVLGRRLSKVVNDLQIPEKLKKIVRLEYIAEVTGNDIPLPN